VGYRLDPAAPVEAEVRRVAGELLGDAVRRLRNEPPSVDDIHKSRTDLKKLRSLVRLVAVEPPARAGSPGRVARNAARRLSAQRDHAVMAETFESLVPDLVDHVSPQTLLRARAGLVSASAALRRSAGPEPVEREVADDLDALALSTAMWRVRGEGFDAIADGLRTQYDRGRRALADLGPAPHAEDLHELRKRVKDHWYHLRLLRAAWTPVMTALAAEAHVLAEHLGADHDLSVLATVLAGDGPDLLGEDRAAVLGTIEGRRADLLVAIRAGARRAYADKPGALTRRLERWWAESAKTT
jgi:CHAD domain-containing protein